MKRISYSGLFLAALMMLASGIAIAAPSDPLVCPGYTPTPNSATKARLNHIDCPTGTSSPTL